MKLFLIVACLLVSYSAEAMHIHRLLRLSAKPLIKQHVHFSTRKRNSTPYAIAAQKTMDTILLKAISVNNALDRTDHWVMWDAEVCDRLRFIYSELDALEYFLTDPSKRDS